MKGPMTTTDRSHDVLTSVPPLSMVHGWRRRPVISVLLRSAIVLIPLAAAGVMGLIAGWAVGGDGVGATILRVIVAGPVSIATFVGFETMARRFLPLATLLKLSLVFPDRAPSRFSVALRSTSVHKLQQWARAAQHEDGPAALAEKVVTLATALNTHDRRTRGHSERSRATAELIALEMRLPPRQVNEIRWGAFLHDIGKILVPAALLNKPGPPTASEWKTLRRHPANGGNLVEPLRAFLGSGVEAVSGHHENYDGTGYPLGLAGNQIALSARIVHVADSFEVMTAVRSYKRPMKATEARDELARNSGTQFDPEVVRALLNVSLGRLHWSLGIAAWMAELPFLTVIPRAAAQVGAIAATPTVSVSAISGVAAISLGSIVAPSSLAPTPVSAAALSGSRSVATASAPAAGGGGGAMAGMARDQRVTAPAVATSAALTASTETPPASGTTTAADDEGAATPTETPAPAANTPATSIEAASPTKATGPTKVFTSTVTARPIASPSSPPLVAASSPTPIASPSSTPPLVAASSPTPIDESASVDPASSLVTSSPTPITSTTTPGKSKKGKGKGKS